MTRMKTNSVRQGRSSRFEFLRRGLVRLGAVALGLVGWISMWSGRRRNLVWQIDPTKCVQCERCATECVLSPSAVKCVQSYPICGYCQLCFGYFQPNAPQFTPAAENQLCPTGAIERLFVEEPYWEYNIIEDACIGCAKCVKACELFGNGSFYLQVRHDRCLNCNNCSIAMKCPSGAWERVPVSAPYQLKHRAGGTDSREERNERGGNGSRGQGGAVAVNRRGGHFGGSSWWIVLLAVLLSFGWVGLAASEGDLRFPAPEFKSGYEFPETLEPEPVGEVRQWIDVVVLAGALGLASWLAVARHSRRGIFWLMIFSLLYFGFYKQGCICPIGSIQNVALALFDPKYAVPGTVLIFFLLPLVFALFFGRVFCSSVCALGAIQDLVVIRPLTLSRKVTVGLSVIPYAYLGLAVMLAATGTAFLVCRFDPFVGFFRLAGNAPFLYLGAGFLLVGTVIARPYCRFFCPYGVLLGWMSRFSWRHLAITPTECVKCRLCETSCPFDHIQKPNLGLARENRNEGVRRLGLLIVMLPVLIGLCGWVGQRLSVPLSQNHSTVALAERILAEGKNPGLEPTLETQAFRSKGMTEAELLRSALEIRAKLEWAGWWVGGFVGLVFGLKLIGFSTVRTRADYEVDRTHCLSCARCCTACPNDPQHGLNLKFLATGTESPPDASGKPRDLVKGS